ncbi:MAG: hypothetical protein H6570_19080 [Lewinellaceae bacterium]|nr:hypothetical protein [Lewinellaceae bacterium]
MEYSINEHFKKNEPIVREIYDRIISECQKFGTVIQSPKKSSIHLDNKSGFAGVYTRKNYILLKIHTNFAIDSERIQKIEIISANRFKHTIKLESLNEVDSELINWLKSAYDIKNTT